MYGDSRPLPLRKYCSTPHVLLREVDQFRGDALALERVEDTDALSLGCREVGRGSQQAQLRATNSLYCTYGDDSPSRRG